MAHERLSPRQKMIGMMYLVLTAMLALNVSKEAVEAFMKVDRALTKTIANYAAKNSEIYAQFDAMAAQNAAKWGEARDKANEIRQRSDELYDYMQNLKVEIITEAEGADTEALKGKEVIIEKVQKIDENNIPSQILIGSDEKGKANDLKALINSYREDMIKIVNGKNITIEESLKSIFNTDPGINKYNEKERWENFTFQALPLVAVITILSKMQVDVRNAETDVLNFLYQQIEAKAFKFNKLVSVVQSSSNYVMQGGEYNASVFFSAIDTLQAPVITVGQVRKSTNADGSYKYEMVGDYATLPLDDAGRGMFKVRGTSIGPKVWGGLISLTAPDGSTLSLPFDGKYSVGENAVVVSATAMNVLYAGIENPIDVSVPGVGSDRVVVTMSSGKIEKGKVKNAKGEFFAGEYKALPPAEKIGQTIQIAASVREENGRLTPYPGKDYRVKAIPKAVATFAQKSGDAKVGLAEIQAQAAVFANPPDFDFNLPYKVTEFKITINEKGFDQSVASTSHIITPEQKALLSRLVRNKKVYIEGIKAIGPDGRIQELSPVIITVN